jgi:hypothetical protein
MNGRQCTLILEQNESSPLFYVPHLTHSQVLRLPYYFSPLVQAIIISFVTSSCHSRRGRARRKEWETKSAVYFLIAETAEDAHKQMFEQELNYRLGTPAGGGFSKLKATRMTELRTEL